MDVGEITGSPERPSLDLVSYTEIAERVVNERLAPSMSRQRVIQLHRGTKRVAPDPDFPEVVAKTGRSRLFEWESVKRYFEKRDTTRGRHKGWTRPV
jgi:hypothetical protein